MEKARSIANADAFKDFHNALESLHPKILETSVTEPAQIYTYYNEIDKLYIWLKNAYGTELLSVENEMRAILGHMSEYELDNDNLPKAYGHIRRMCIDVLKILCNGFDQEFEEWIITHAAFDYKKHDNLYMPEYVKKYSVAHRKYLEAQQKENLGSNKHNCIIEKYYEAAVLYGDLYKYHINKRREQIHMHYLGMMLQRKLWILATSIVTTISIIGYFISR